MTPGDLEMDDIFNFVKFTTNPLLDYIFYRSPRGKFFVYLSASREEMLLYRSLQNSISPGKSDQKPAHP